MNSTYFGAKHYNIHVDKKLNYTISRIFQEMSLSELETLHQLCELERTQILQSLAIAVLKIPYAGYLLSGKRSNFFDYEENIFWFYTCTKKVSPLYVFEDKRCYKRIPIFYKNKVHCSQVSNGNKNQLDHESFYQSYIERLLHLKPDDCKNKLLGLNLTKNENSHKKIVNFQVFADSVHQAELERYQGHIKLDERYPYNGAHGRLTYEIHDKHWISHIGKNNPSNCKADTKNKGYQEIMFFNWKIQLQKIQLTQDLKDNTIIYQGIRLPCKTD